MSFLTTLKRRWVTVLITLGLAFASGHIMQNGLFEQAADRAPPEHPDLPADMQNSALMPPPVMRDRAHDRWLALGGAPGCRPRFSVTPAPAATLRIDLYAPCKPDASVVLRQGPVVASLRTDAKGRLNLRMPALGSAAEVSIELDGNVVTARTEVPGAEDYRHAILAWEGPQTLRINAYEFGASKRQMGHVWAGSPKSPARAVRGTGGFLTRIGDGDGSAVEIYSFPLGRFSGHGVIRLVVEADVTERNCARDLLAEAFRSKVDGTLVRTEIALAMPACDRVGEIVRLQNLFRDMRLAAR